MNKTLSLAIATLGLLTFGSLTSCQDEDFDVSTAVLQERAFEQSFINEFGKPSANQSWDFYAQKMESIRREAGMTRATMADPIVVEVDTTISQPTDKYFTDIVNDIAFALEEKINNSNTGQNNYTLTSTGDFKIYAVRYAGAIETGAQYDFDFGIAYIDPADDQEHKVSIFGRGYRNKAYRDSCYAHNSNGWGNPGKAADVKIPKGISFYFYFDYTNPFRNGGPSIRQHFYSNESPVFVRKDGVSTFTFPEFGGTTTLLYSTDHIDPVTGRDEQVMMIGLEDAWGHDNGNDDAEGTQTGWFDKDFNDVVVLIEGELPVPTSKRFFTEDKKSYDWDYNDVVFDVSNTGIVLRAVGGTLPVFLRVKNRLPESTYELVSLKADDGKTYAELHELMRAIQPQTGKRTFPLTYQRQELDGSMGTYYKPIDVAAYEVSGIEMIWFDAVQIVRWISLGTSTQNTRLEEDEVERFANPLVSDPVGGVELIVLPEYKTSYNLTEIAALDALTALDEDNTLKGAKIVTMTEVGGIPAMWSGPVSINWMKEEKKITTGYSNFYGGGTADDDGIPQWWENGLNSDNWYQYWGDYELP
ncbi:MAG: hypothetical protein IKX25_01050 [Bacteroidales bacterium]|nr:hypothetical protein [Bacteroidales bacterium]